MKRIMCVIESLDYAFLEQVSTPNIDEVATLGYAAPHHPHPAIPYGITSASAASAFACGFMPICTHDRGDCVHNDINWTDPFYLETLIENGTVLFLHTSNGWTFHAFEPFMSLRNEELVYDWHDRHEECVSTEMLDEFEEGQDNILRYGMRGGAGDEVVQVDDWYLYLHVMETHWPFFHPDWYGVPPGEIEDHPDTPLPNERRRMALEWVDEHIVGRILEYDYDELVVTADHPLSHPGDHREYAQDVLGATKAEEFQVFLTTHGVHNDR